MLAAAATQPHMLPYVGWWVGVFTILTIILALCCIAIWAAEEEHTRADILVLFTIWFFVVIILTAVLWLLNHAAWIDYRRVAQ